jgi:uncharacterized protein
MKSSSSERKFMTATLADVDEDGAFHGYASLFGVSDLSKDIVEKGAFANALKARGAGGIRMLFQHDPAEPIGVWTEIREDQRGLFVKGQLNTEVARAREVLALMRGKALDGLSIGFRTVRSRADPSQGVRRIIEADLWEISVVTFPMLPGARVAQVKALPTIREFERWLTRDAGLTRSDARTVIARGFASLNRRRDAATTAGELTGTIRAATRILQTGRNS